MPILLRFPKTFISELIVGKVFTGFYEGIPEAAQDADRGREHHCCE